MQFPIKKVSNPHAEVPQNESMTDFQRAMQAKRDFPGIKLDVPRAMCDQNGAKIGNVLVKIEDELRRRKQAGPNPQSPQA